MLTLYGHEDSGVVSWLGSSESCSCPDGQVTAICCRGLRSTRFESLLARAQETFTGLATPTCHDAYNRQLH